MVTNAVLYPVEEITPHILRNCIPALVHFREKFNALGEHLKISCRMCAAGDQDKAPIVDAISSSMVDDAAKMATLCIARGHGKKLCFST